jgi:hypothetical protein
MGPEHTIDFDHEWPGKPAESQDQTRSVPCNLYDSRLKQRDEGTSD